MHIWKRRIRVGLTPGERMGREWEAFGSASYRATVPPLKLNCRDVGREMRRLLRRHFLTSTQGRLRLGSLLLSIVPLFVIFTPNQGGGYRLTTAKAGRHQASALTEIVFKDPPGRGK